MNARPVLGQEREQLELLVREAELAAGQPRLVAGEIDHQLVDLHQLVGAERRRTPVELPDPGVQLGRHQRGEHEVVEPCREVEPGQAGQRQGDQDRHLGQGPAAPNLLHRAQRPGHVVAGVDHHHRRRRRSDGALVEIAQIEPRQGDRPSQIGQVSGDRGAIVPARGRLDADHQRTHAGSDRAR